MLEVSDLHTLNLKSVTFSISSGECVTVSGGSGAGKSLLLRAIADLDPSRGRVSLDGRDRLSFPAPEWRRLVGYMSAEPGWWAGTVGQHFRDWATAAALCAMLGFDAGAERWPVAQLSTGERLRLALVRALVMRPRVLLLDEPTAALDPASIKAVESVISCHLREGLAVLWVTHDSAQARRVARRRLVVECGRAREEVDE